MTSGTAEAVSCRRGGGAFAGARWRTKSYLAVRNDYARLIADELANPERRAEHEVRRDAVAATLNQVDTLAPQTSARAYQRARVALQDGQELSFSPGELDRLLPEALRASSH